MAGRKAAIRRFEPVSAVVALTGALRRLGWMAATPTDRYTKAAGIQWLEPVMPARTGHTPARLVIAGETVGLSTFTREGEAMEQVSWGWVDPHNLQRVHDYVTAALADAMSERGEI